MKALYFIMGMILFAASASAQTTKPVISLAADIEDGKKMVHAVVSVNGKPRENVVLQYFVQRTFGNLQIGEDTTLDDGTSAVAFPSDLPGGSDGKLHFTVRIKAPADFVSVSAAQAFDADLPHAAAADEFPRALWAPHAPLGLMLSIGVLLAGIWFSYAFALNRILAIRIGGKP